MAATAANRRQAILQAGRRSDHKPFGRQLWEARWCYLFIAPSLILASLFTFYPTVASWYFSLLQWTGFTAARTFVGLSNYAEVIHDGYFWQAFERSFLFMLGAVPVKLFLTLVVAIVLNDAALRLAPVFRTLFFIPVVTTAAIDGIVMTFIFNPFNGPLNKALLAIGALGRPVDYLGNPSTALWTIVAVFIWKSFGITMMYWLAALQVVPKDLYEAARVDGAASWQIHRYVTVPLILPFALIIIMLNIAGSLHVFALVQTMTGGGPFFASEVMEVYIYRNAFGGSGGVPRLGYASAAAVWFGICVMVIALAQGWVAKQANERRRELGQRG